MTKLPHPLLPGFGQLRLLLLLAVVCFHPLHGLSPTYIHRAEDSRMKRSGKTLPNPVPDPPQPPGNEENNLHENEYFVSNGVPHQGHEPVDPTPDIDHMADNPDDVIDPQDPAAEEEANATTRQKRSRDSTAANHRQKRGLYHINPNVFWAKGIVPFVIEKDKLPKGDIDIIYWAMALISNHTCIRFVPWNSTTKSQYGLPNDGRIKFTKLPSCASYVGNVYTPGSQGQALYCCHHETCVHELGHALGLGHEQQHDDKDIIRKDWFKQHPTGRISYMDSMRDENVFTRFDLSSPMHYSMAEIKGSMTMLFPEVKRIMRFLYFFQLISDIYKCQERHCSNFTRKCHNAGFVTTVNGKCDCMCPRHLERSSGCTTVMTKTLKQTFPGGSYAFPCPREGCPPGFRSFTVNHTYPSVGDWGTKLLKDTVANNAVNNVLCAPISSSPNAVSWPPGAYCIYRNHTCPPGFKHTNLTLETSPGKNAGDWEDMEIGNDYLTFHFCCRQDGLLESMEMTNSHPFVLLMKSYWGCQKIAGMGVTRQNYVTDDPLKKNLFSGKTGLNTEGPFLNRYSSGATVFYLCYYYPLSDNPFPVQPCKDKGQDCPKQVISGQCDNSQVAQNCSYSCDKCPGVADTSGKCVDKDPNCQPSQCPNENCKFTCRLCPEFCGEIIKLTREKPSHQITSPNFPNPYRNALDCFWQITGPPGSTLLLTFDTFDLEGNPSSCKDSLEINHFRINYAGNKFCGKDLWMTVRSIFNEMELRLITNHENQRQGFNATVTLALPENHCYDPKGKGRDYRGDVSYTRDFKPCVPWNETKTCRHSAFAAYDLEDDLRENFCRNPGNGMRPWCYTSTNCDRNYCDVCFLETPYDTANDCSQFKAAGSCSKDHVEARRKCARTCNDVLPPRIKPAPFGTKSCGKPVPPADGTAQQNVSSSSPVGTNVSYACKDNPNMIGRTVCLPNSKWSPLGYVCGACPEGWTLHDNNCFLKAPSGKNFDNAKDYCIRHKAQIAEARTEDDMRFLFRLRDDGRDLWMALRGDSNQCFYWEDKTLPSVTKWRKGTDGNVPCTIVTPMMEWTTTSCKHTYLFVCQRPALNVSQCVDFIPDCDKWIQKIPTACQEADFAKFSCPKTCYGSTNCQDPCASSPCQNGGKCYVRGGTFQCLCSAGYSGTRCEVKCQFSECSDKEAYCSQLNPKDCANSSHADNCRKTCGLCVDGPNCRDKHESCPEWIIQKKCKTDSETRRLCPHGCNLCYNPSCYDVGSTCWSHSESKCDQAQLKECAYSCHLCSNNSKCYNLPCKNGGICSENSAAANGFTCNCTGTGFEGPTCESAPLKCNSQPCKNGGSCSEDSGAKDGYSCNCTGTGFQGPTCEQAVSKCKSTPCKNGASCQDNSAAENGYTCNCTGTGFEGPTCEQAVSKCKSTPCKNGASCQDNSAAANGYTCNCTGTGFEGPTCEQVESKCKSTPCKNGGTCKEDSSAKDGYTCHCSGTGFEGPTCEEAEFHCDCETCLNGGLCFEDDEGLYCDCSDTGFEGPTCEEPKLRCDSETCLNGGRCYVDDDELYCDCTGTGHEGTTCEEPIPDKCGKGWILRLGYCYKAFDTKKRHKEARTTCSKDKKGATLPIISSAEENRFVFELAKKKPIWLDATRARNDKPYIWSDGKTVSRGYSNWSPDQPKGKDVCAVLRRRNGKWRTISCNKKRRFVCKVKEPE